MAPRAVVSIDSLPASGRFTVTGGVGFPRTTLAQYFAAFRLSTVVFPGFDHNDLRSLTFAWFRGPDKRTPKIVLQSAVGKRHR